MTFRSIDPGAGLGATRVLTRRALSARAGPGADVDSWLEHVEGAHRRGGMAFTVLEIGGRAVGVVAWEAGGPLGAHVEVLYADPDVASPGTYLSLLEHVEAGGRTVAFAPGRLVGLTEADEQVFMTGRGFARYGRSEMIYPDDRPAPAFAPGQNDRSRGVTRADVPKLIELHLRAYHGTFDRYLFLEQDDEPADAAREVGEIVGGRWGALEPRGSRLIELDGVPVASVLAVEGPNGVLLADVAVDPVRQGQGWGRAVLTSSVRALRERGDRRIRLNVTEGNGGAVRLYERLGFARSLGPTRDWYNTTVIPVAPGERS